MKFKLFKVRHGKVKTWTQWGRALVEQYKAEAIETLLEEGLTYEGFCVFQVGGEWYAIAAEDGRGRPANRGRELNMRHRAMKEECLEYVGLAEMVYEFYGNLGAADKGT